MISVEEARTLIQKNLEPLPIKEIPLHEVAGHYAAVDIHSPYDHPLFDNSAVDGYAFAFGGEKKFKVVAEIAAGERSDRKLQSGECARIFTGAMMPPGTDTVVMQEFVSRNGSSISHSDPKLVRGSNVRLKGEQLRTGDQVLAKGDPISPAASGLLASVGIRKVKVHEWPYITIVITGGEFVQEEPEPGRIFSSNDLMLSAALRNLGIQPVILRSADDPIELKRTLRQALAKSDLLITTGGVSVGDHDLVVPILKELELDLIFHKVAQKPGKPMLFGKAGPTVVFGLPGNPRAVLVLFWEYILPTIRAMMGAERPGLDRNFLPIAHGVTLKGDRSEFRAGRTENGSVELLRDEGSHMLSSLIEADVLVYFPAHIRNVEAGTEVEVHHIPKG